ncbi:MAG: methyltransferase domain-containing protein, partial [Pseudomonadota bacterium]
DAIKSMKLYNSVERIHRDLESVGVGPDDPVTVDLLSRFDQLHYFGTDAVDEAIHTLNAGPSDRILDIGAGYGGPARYLASRTGSRVTAVELQPDLNAVASDLTRRTGLADQVSHMAADIHQAPLDTSGHSGAISYLAVYHIPERSKLLTRLADALAPASAIYFEDLYCRQSLTDQEEEIMQDALYANSLTDKEAYISELEAAGFTDIDFQDMSDAWGAFTAERLAEFRAVAEEKTRTHGADVVAALDMFYNTVSGLFAAGNLGGVRLTARSPG